MKKQSLKASLLLKIMMVCAAIISMGFSIWLAVSAYQIGSGPEAIGGYATSIGIFFVLGLVGKRAFDLLSVTLTEKGVMQTALFSRNHLFVKNEIFWGDVTDITEKSGTFLLSGRGNTIEVNTEVFNNAEEVIDFVKTNCDAFGWSHKGAN